uniref:hypothetical protein n=1 Tax=Escherichia coli TaxID=562 RepID=UPI001BC89C32
ELTNFCHGMWFSPINKRQYGAPLTLTLVSPVMQQVAAPVRGRDETTVAEVTEMKNSERLNDMPHL